MNEVYRKRLNTAGASLGVDPVAFRRRAARVQHAASRVGGDARRLIKFHL